MSRLRLVAASPSPYQPVQVASLVPLTSTRTTPTAVYLCQGRLGRSEPCKSPALAVPSFEC